MSNSTTFPVDQCPPDTSTIFTNIKSSLECSCNLPENSNTPLCLALKSGQLLNTTPFKCMIDVIEKHSTCGTTLTPETKQAAYQAFTDVTGYKPLDMQTVFETLNKDTYTIVTYTAFYIFMPVLLLFLIIVWLMVGFQWIHWPLGIFITVLAFVVLYGFSIGYRINAQNYLNQQTEALKNLSISADENLKTTIAYLPQGQYAVACSIASNGNPNAWKCNKQPNNCNVNTKSCSGGVCNLADEDYLSDETEPEETRRRRRRNNRNNRKNN